MNRQFNLAQQRLGQQGEQWAVDYLRAHGYTIIDRNVYLRWAEIDIIARRHGTIHFFEVKTRRTNQFGRPSAAVSGKKIQKIQAAAHYYLAQQRLTFRGLALGVIECWYNKGKWYIRCIPNIVL